MCMYAIIRTVNFKPFFPVRSQQLASCQSTRVCMLFGHAEFYHQKLEESVNLTAQDSLFPFKD